ncbi:MAG: hypothetical protein P857_77 [Candidatus Xenolissoclinum pacificiensis L6]|uniref:Uncharacterized protein n=1 Tax=Candidatus Xenolissoclinum pacificiensis L6 TaxID=1401685 RepID=W2UZC2_9RICK|nr:MAG: hypothetical protein P857_77 [Candidatus Xenolissoclinum pacificiensis L6]
MVIGNESYSSGSGIEKINFLRCTPNISGHSYEYQVVLSHHGQKISYDVFKKILSSCFTIQDSKKSIRNLYDDFEKGDKVSFLCYTKDIAETKLFEIQEFSSSIGVEINVTISKYLSN